MMMTTKPIGLYVHIPFCVRKCNYCDFCSFDALTADWRERYIDALVAEIKLYCEKCVSVDSIFFGGGTPSLLTPNEFRRINEAIRSTFLVTSDCEFTVEANPGTVNEEILDCFVDCGVNRLSIGLQSIHENELKTLGRIHNLNNFMNSFYLARRAGINNINVDLMYGIPEQTKESFSETLDAITALSPEHISLYGLIIEEGTPFFDWKNNLSLPAEDDECDMYYFAADYLRDRGFVHYEISNYAKPGYECRHNLKYWRCEEYIGAGISAHSYYDSKRYGNSTVVNEYLSDFQTKKEAETLDCEEKAYEYVMLRLRLKEGFSLVEYKNLFGKDFLATRYSEIQELCKNGYVIIDNDRISLTEKGFYVSNIILSDLL